MTTTPIATTAGAARQRLAASLATLQQDPNLPPPILAMVQGLARAMGPLFQVERGTGDPSLLFTARTVLQETLGKMQELDQSYPGVGEATAAIAQSLGMIFSCIREHNLQDPSRPAGAAGPSPSTPAVAPPSQPPPQPAAVVPRAPRASPEPPAPPAPQPVAPPAPYLQPVAQPPPPSQPPPVPQPMQFAPTAPVAQVPPSQPPPAQPAQPAQPAPLAQPIPLVQHAPPAAPVPAPYVLPNAGAGPVFNSAPPPRNADPPRPSGPSVPLSQPTGLPLQGGGPRLREPSHYPDTAAKIPVGPNGIPYIEAELDVHSETNFYTNFLGDIRDHGGIFVATWGAISLNTACEVRMSFPGELTADVRGVVRWKRDASGDVSPGIGVEITQASPDAWQLIDRFMKKREPIIQEF